MNLTDNYDGALQKPLGTGFNARSTTKEVIKGIDLSGKTAIVTGGYAGIGLETIKTFVSVGASVIIPARDTRKAASNLKGIPNTTIEPMDLMDPDSINNFANKFLGTNTPLHILVNNAGIMWVPLQRDQRGYESQLATNHLGHFQLTAKLWPALKKAAGARVVNVSSYGHQMAPFNFDDPNFMTREYETLQGYGQSKTANNLFTVELDHRGKTSGIRAFSVHPGSVIGTDLGRVAPMALFQQMGTHDANGDLFPEVAARLKDIAQGAATSVWCATSPQLNALGGVYCEDSDIAQLDMGDILHNYNDPSTLRGVQPYSLDARNAKRLWRSSEEMTGLTFEHHILVWFISGETKIIQSDATHTFTAGDIFLIPRNQLTTVINYPKDGKPHKTVAMHITRDRLQDFYTRHKAIGLANPLQKIHIFRKHPLLESCLASLIPWFDLEEVLPANIASIKIEEGSIATFRRDFKKAFNTTPQKWLTERRLELAHYQIGEKHRKPIDVYFEVGFENLSHFSHAFKKHFGYAPNTIK